MVIVQKESWQDYKDVEALLKAAFESDEEAILVNRLRTGEAFIPELSLVARLDYQIVGHILCTRLPIQDTEGSFTALALAPLAVHPRFRKQGFGSKLIHMAISESKRLGYSLVIVLGSPDYYRRFGFINAQEQGIQPPDDNWGDAFQVLELIPGALKEIQGRAVYPPEFGIES